MSPQISHSVQILPDNINIMHDISILHLHTSRTVQIDFVNYIIIIIILLLLLLLLLVDIIIIIIIYHLPILI